MSRRTSGRKRKISKRLAEAEVLDDSQIFGSSPEPPQFQVQDLGQSSDQESEFDVVEAEGEADESPASGSPEENESIDSNELDDDAKEIDDDLSDIVDDDDDDDGIGDATGASRRRRAPAGSYRQSETGLTTKSVIEPHEVGIHSVLKHVPKEKAFCYANGDDLEANELLVRMQDRWFDDETLPSRRPSARHPEGFDSVLLPSTNHQAAGSDHGWAWYQRSETLTTFRVLQQHLELNAEALAGYQNSFESTDFIIGGSNQTTVSTIEASGARSLQSLWSAASLASIARDEESMRYGWLLNVGQCVTILKWVPNRNGPVQYLSIASKPEISLGKASVDQRAADTPSAFVPGEPLPSSIDIWQMTCRRNSKKRSPNDELPPRKYSTLCFDFGPIKALDWCPVARDLPAEENDQQADLGLLATIHGDGYLRVFKLPFPGGRKTKGARSIKILKAAFQARPPGTVHTAFAWISSSSIAAGCANGFLAVYDLDQHFGSGRSSNDATPIIYEAFHETYIFSVTCCRPSRPHLLVTTAMDGRWRLTDLRDPTSGHAFSRRERTPPVCTTWHDHTQSIMSADEACNIRSAFARDINTLQYLAIVSASVRDVGVSSLHPSALIGCTDGTVYVINPLRIILRGRLRDNEDNYKQAWFRHDWRRGRPSTAGARPCDLKADKRNPVMRKEKAVNGQDRGSPQESSDFPRGLTRLTSGFRLEGARDATCLGAKNNRKTSGAMRTTTTTIYEREASVTALAWNPNPCAGGWAAAGMGDGLVIIEDLSFDGVNRVETELVG